LVSDIQGATQNEGENRVLKRIIGPKRNDVRRGWRKLHNEELHSFSASPSTIRMIKSMALWLAIQVIEIGIFDQLDQAYWLISFTKKIQSFGRRRNVNARGNASRGAGVFGLVLYSF
jgi:hypothetical protein